MLKINSNYLNVGQSYLFSTIAKKVNDFTAANPDRKIIRMGIGDVTRPLCKAVIDGLNAGVADMASSDTFKGYGPEQGYGFMHDAVAAYYAKRGVELATDEIFISDGAKSDIGNILDIFAVDNKVMIPDPVYPVYVDTNIMAGRDITFIDATEENGFLPLPDSSMSAAEMRTKTLLPLT